MLSMSLPRLVGAALIANSTVWMQVKNLPNEVVWQLISGLTVLVLLIMDTGELIYAAADRTKPSYAACAFCGIVQFSWVLLAGYFLIRGIWLENAFQMDAAAAMVFILVAINLDKTLTAISVAGTPPKPLLREDGKSPAPPPPAWGRTAA